MQSRPKTNNSVLPEHDVKMLESLYELRAMTTEQLGRRHNYTMWTMYKKVQKLRKEGYIITDTIKGYIPGKSRQGDYHRISGKGITLLKSRGYPVEYTADELRVGVYRLPYLLSTNDMLLDLEGCGWDLIDSRETKDIHGLNRGDNLLGMLRSPGGKEYPFYIFINRIGIKNLNRIKKEIERYLFSDMLLFTKSKESFNQILEAFMNNSDVLKYQTFCILPYGFGKRYLPLYNNPSNLFSYLSLEYDIEQIDSPIATPQGLDLLVTHDGEEKYLVNLLDNDLNKVYNIKRYRKEDYERDGRKVLLLTNMLSVHKELFEHVHHVEYLEIDSASLLSYSSTYPFSENTNN